MVSQSKAIEKQGPESINIARGRRGDQQVGTSSLKHTKAFRREQDERILLASQQDNTDKTIDSVTERPDRGRRKRDA